MTTVRIAVLGGDGRELHIAERLMAEGYDVALFGYGGEGSASVRRAGSAAQAVEGAQWIILPSPGMSEGDRLYAPSSPEPIVVDESLLAASDVSRGGIVLGRATPTLEATAARFGVALFEMKDDLELPISNATSASEALVALLVGKTRRVLPEHRFLVLGYGATGAAVTDALLGLACKVSVAARRPDALARVRQRGATPVHFAERLVAMAGADIVMNTVPSIGSIPAEAFPVLKGRLVVDIASPPGGIDHEAARDAGVDVTWARGLAGARAPLSAGDSQFRIVVQAIQQAG